MASRVVPATSDTMERLLLVSLLVSELFPAFGRPMMATLMASTSSSGTISTFRSSFTTSSSRSPVPLPCWALTGHGSPSPNA